MLSGQRASRTSRTHDKVELDVDARRRARRADGVGARDEERVRQAVSPDRVEKREGRDESEQAEQ